MADLLCKRKNDRGTSSIFLQYFPPLWSFVCRSKQKPEILCAPLVFPFIQKHPITDFWFPLKPFISFKTSGAAVFFLHVSVSSAFLHISVVSLSHSHAGVFFSFFFPLISPSVSSFSLCLVFFLFFFFCFCTSHYTHSFHKQASYPLLSRR